MSIDPRAATGFAHAAELYERGRPSYPPGAIARLIDNFGVPPDGVLLDLAAGTAPTSTGHDIASSGDQCGGSAVTSSPMRWDRRSRKVVMQRGVALRRELTRSAGPDVHSSRSRRQCEASSCLLTATGLEDPGTTVRRLPEP